MELLQQLAMRQSNLTKQIRALKKDSASDFCHFEIVDYPWLKGQALRVNETNCIQRAYDLMVRMNHESRGSDGYSFEEVFNNMDDQPCSHCRKVYENKQKRRVLQAELGRVKASITRIGTNLIKHQSGNGL